MSAQNCEQIIVFMIFTGVLAMFAVAQLRYKGVRVIVCGVSAADSCSRPQLVATRFMHDNWKDWLVVLNFLGVAARHLPGSSSSDL